VGCDQGSDGGGKSNSISMRSTEFRAWRVEKPRIPDRCRIHRESRSGSAAAMLRMGKRGILRPKNNSAISINIDIMLLISNNFDRGLTCHPILTPEIKWTLTPLF